MVFTACRGRFVVWFDNRDDQAPAAVHASPTYTAGIPRRGIDWYDVAELPFEP